MAVPVANQRTWIDSAFSQTVTRRFMQSPCGSGRGGFTLPCELLTVGSKKLHFSRLMHGYVMAPAADS